MRYDRRTIFVTLLCLLILLFTTVACAPTPEGNVVGYLLAKQLGTIGKSATSATGSVTGQVVYNGAPVAGAAVVIAEPYGRPHAAQTDASGYYRIVGIPAGQYVPAAVAPGFEETVAQGWLHVPTLVDVQAGSTTVAPTITLVPHVARPLPAPLPTAVNLTATRSYTAATNFPAGATAQVTAYTFTYNNATVDTLRLYLPEQISVEQLPLLYLVYPTAVDGWESVSVSFAASGYALVAISPIAQRAVDIDAHAQDARVALALAQGGYLHPAIAPEEAVVLGGSFSSPILHRLLRDEAEQVAAWITVGGIANGFSQAEDFYAGRIQVPPQYELAIPALGMPNLYPRPFLSYSPVYTAAQLPPTLIIHTDVDQVTPIDQAYELEAALAAADVPVEVYYYEDVSHYLQIGDAMTEAGVEMFYRVLDFAKRYQTTPPQPTVALP